MPILPFPAKKRVEAHKKKGKVTPFLPNHDCGLENEKKNRFSSFWVYLYGFLVDNVKSILNRTEKQKAEDFFPATMVLDFYRI